MDLIHKIFNVILPPLTLITLLLIVPPYLLYRFISYIKRSIYIENVAGKVVLITGASSGIGEHLAYEYARRGARLALVARREHRLRAVADKAIQMGSPDVIVIRADVSKVEDSKRFVDETVNHFGQLDHLINNAAISKIGMFEDSPQISDFLPVMDINFWGSVYGTHFAVPHLRKSKGKIVVMASSAGWFPTPRISIYNASKVAQISLFETLRTEFGTDIGITIVTPGLIESEMTTSEYLTKVGMDNSLPPVSTARCAKAIVNSTCRGDTYLTEPSWVRIGFLFKLFCPQLLEWCFHLQFVTLSKTSRTNPQQNSQDFLNQKNDPHTATQPAEFKAESADQRTH